ncbi:MAG: endonuclease [Bacteroidales bacterium]|nr:endonuclease [Bacteroidales bacterium]
MKRHLTILFLSVSLIGVSQIPNGYYNQANGKTGDALKVALHDIIKGHTTVSYSNLWDAFWSTDNKGDGVVWDMYSDVPGGMPPYTYQLGEGQCGEYNSEGDCYNREHSWPKSWFGSQTTPECDLHHIFPTDGFVNQKRDNYPFGKVQSATWTSQNGSKLGTCKASLGYSGTVFEPIDAYKGDFARALMYMSVRYYGEDSNWGSSDMTNKSEILPWAIAMLMDWNEQDPVSQKEIDRNNAIYTDYQHNRNPFVDHPEYARMIWDPDWQGGGGSGGNTGNGDYVKVTTAPTDWSGEYLLVYENNATSGYVWTGVDAANCFQEAAITDYSIEDNGFVTIIIAPMSGGYSIRINGGTNDGKYIYGQSGNNTIRFGTSASLNTLEYESDWVKITSNTSVMRFNKAASEMRFRYYKAASYLNNNIESVQLYKKTDGQTVEQSIALAQGWNWWAPTVETTLEALQTALGNTLMQIKSQDGTPTELVLGQMYRIQANAACEISLSGAPAGNVTINITSGCNWFGYPGTESLSLDDLDISPTTGDKVVSQDGGFAVYNGTAWKGTLTSLQPGKGYVYVSVDNQSKTLTF